MRIFQRALSIRNKIVMFMTASRYIAWRIDFIASSNGKQNREQVLVHCGLISEANILDKTAEASKHALNATSI